MNFSAGVMRRPRLSRVRTAAAIITTTGLALLATACGASPSSIGSGGSSNTTGSTAAYSTNSQKALAYAQCMRTKGVSNFPDPSSNGQFNKVTLAQLANSDSRFQPANHACQRLLPNPSVAQRRNMAAQALQFSHCMRSHGVTNFPDPAGDGRIPDPATFGIDQGSPQFEAANQACGKYRPAYVPSNAAYNAYARTQG